MEGAPFFPFSFFALSEKTANNGDLTGDRPQHLKTYWGLVPSVPSARYVHGCFAKILLLKEPREGPFLPKTPLGVQPTVPKRPKGRAHFLGVPLPKTPNLTNIKAT